jgi:hypothetical protein
MTIDDFRASVEYAIERGAVRINMHVGLTKLDCPIVEFPQKYWSKPGWNGIVVNIVGNTTLLVPVGSVDFVAFDAPRTFKTFKGEF